MHHGAVLLEQKRIGEAVTAAGQALALNPDNHDACNLMGRAAYERGELGEALAHFRRALALKPDLADALNNMGNVLKELGKLAQAHEAYCKALRLEPDMTGAYVNLADAKTFAPGDAHLAAMESLVAKSKLSQRDRMQLDFALGKAYADLKDYRRSFSHFSAGNAAKRATISYDEQAAASLFERIEAVFSRELLAAKAGGGHACAVPIFIVGMPRSGTSLVEQILASHPAVHGGGELPTLDDVICSARGSDAAVPTYPEFVAALDGRALRRIGEHYSDLIGKLCRAATRITDKMPSNFLFAGLIHLALPQACIIHTIRDPLDTCVSCFSKLFTAEQDYSYDLGELGRYYRRYRALMAHWRRVLPQGRMLEVRYEDLVADLGREARRIVTHCGLPWDARCLSFHQTERPVRTASAAQIRQPIYTSAVGRWRFYEQDLGPLFNALGLEGAAEQQTAAE